MGRWSSRCHPLSRAPAGARTHRGTTVAPSIGANRAIEGMRAAMPWAWVTAPTPSTPTGRSSTSNGVRAETHGSIQPLHAWLVTRLGRRARTCPGSLPPPVTRRACPATRRTTPDQRRYIERLTYIEATRGLWNVSTNCVNQRHRPNYSTIGARLGRLRSAAAIAIPRPAAASRSPSMFTTTWSTSALSASSSAAAASRRSSTSPVSPRPRR